MLIFLLDKSFGVLKKFGDAWERSFKNLADDYKKYLNWTLEHGVTVLIIIMIIFFGSMYLFKYVGSEFFAKSDQGFLAVDFELPAGSNLYETDISLSSRSISSTFITPRCTP